MSGQGEDDGTARVAKQQRKLHVIIGYPLEMHFIIFEWEVGVAFYMFSKYKIQRYLFAKFNDSST